MKNQEVESEKLTYIYKFVTATEDGPGYKLAYPEGHQNRARARDRLTAEGHFNISQYVFLEFGLGMAPKRIVITA